MPRIARPKLLAGAVLTPCDGLKELPLSLGNCRGLWAIIPASVAFYAVGLPRLLPGSADGCLIIAFFLALALLFSSFVDADALHSVFLPIPPGGCGANFPQWFRVLHWAVSLCLLWALVQIGDPEHQVSEGRSTELSIVFAGLSWCIAIFGLATAATRRAKGKAPDLGFYFMAAGPVVVYGALLTFLVFWLHIPYLDVLTARFLPDGLIVFALPVMQKWLLAPYLLPMVESLMVVKTGAAEKSTSADVCHWLSGGPRSVYFLLTVGILYLQSRSTSGTMKLAMLMNQTPTRMLLQSRILYGLEPEDSFSLGRVPIRLFGLVFSAVMLWSLRVNILQGIARAILLMRTKCCKEVYFSSAHMKAQDDIEQDDDALSEFADACCDIATEFYEWGQQGLHEALHLRFAERRNDEAVLPAETSDHITHHDTEGAGHSPKAGSDVAAADVLAPVEECGRCGAESDEEATSGADALIGDDMASSFHSVFAEIAAGPGQADPQELEMLAQTPAHVDDETVELGSPELPSIGSKTHRAGGCKPCAFLHKKGCENGVQCSFCHLCGPRDKKRRQQDKKRWLEVCRWNAQKRRRDAERECRLAEKQLREAERACQIAAGRHHQRADERSSLFIGRRADYQETHASYEMPPHTASPFWHPCTVGMGATPQQPTVTDACYWRPRHASPRQGKWQGEKEASPDTSPNDWRRMRTPSPENRYVRTPSPADFGLDGASMPAEPRGADSLANVVFCPILVPPQPALVFTSSAACAWVPQAGVSWGGASGAISAVSAVASASADVVGTEAGVNWIGACGAANTVSEAASASAAVVGTEDACQRCVPAGFGGESEVTMSIGSAGHPHTCGPVCKYFRKARGCKDGAACSHCHLCTTRRNRLPSGTMEA